MYCPCGSECVVIFMKSLEVTNLTIGYGSRVLAHDISFALGAGEIMSVLGPNGVGKSTLLKTLLNMVSPVGEGGVTKQDGSEIKYDRCTIEFGGIEITHDKSGNKLHESEITSEKNKILLDGIELSKMSKTDRAKKFSALLTERFSAGNLYSHEVVEAGRYPYTGHFGTLSEQDRKVTDKISKELEITDLLDKKYSTLSDGQKQRVLLARALCQEPEVLILDEPFSFLDINYRLKISKYLIKKFHEKNSSIILTIQEPPQAFAISDKVLLLFDDGSFEYGTKDEMLTEEKLRRLYQVQDFKFDTDTKNFLL